MRQGTAEWLTWRRAGLGGSDMAAVLGLSPWTTPYQLWLEKTGQLQPQAVTPAMQRGHDYEAEARRAYEAQTGRHMEPCTLEWPPWPVLRVSLDGRSWEGDRILEIKVPGAAAHLEARAGRVPAYYMPQVQTCLLVSGAAQLDYWSYDPLQRTGALVAVPADPVYGAALVEQAKAFWGHVERREAPPLSDRDQVGRNDEAWLSAALLYREAETVCSEWEERRKAARELLILLANGASAKGGGVAVSRVAKTTTAYSQALRALCPDADLTPYQRTTTEWRVRLSEDRDG